ncbi:MAG: CarD family transcriptional regulator [Rickettsiales bacterium]|nr:CarD family transcriptional regulator [Rickettsiales bacterium]
MKKAIEFKVGDRCVYRTHGVAMVKEIQTLELKDFKSKCLILFLEREKMTLTVPENKIESMGVRRLSTKAEMEEVFAILSNGIKKIKGMWSRRAKEYEEKINSGDIFSTAEVIRDLTRDVEEADRSFSERMIYETAVYRLASEYATIESITLQEAVDKIIEVSKQRVKFTDMQQCKLEEVVEA